ncbi:MAG: glutamine synthetase family protein [Candidatus Hodarchaeota archaeon]
MAEKLEKLVKEHNIRYIQFQFTDIFGNLKGVEMPSYLLTKALNERVGIDGSSVGLAHTKKSDLSLLPDPTTLQSFPWNPKVARIICDVKKQDGGPFDCDPRSILRRVLSEAESKGFNYLTRPEIEFYVFQKGQPVDNAGYMDIEPLDKHAEIRREMVDYMINMGMQPKTLHHECGPGQMEIEFMMDDALRTGDNVQTLKLITRMVAYSHGLISTYMPKPIEGKAGSGLHVHQILEHNGKNLFGNNPYHPSEICTQYIAGLFAHSNALTVIGAPTVNSYKRLIPGQEAPVYLTWGIANRTALIRVPGYESNVRIEFRAPDASSNIYLVLAGMLAAGIDGIDKKMHPADPVDYDLDSLSELELVNKGIETLPSNLGLALEHFRNSELMKRTFGQVLIDAFSKVKEDEWNTYSTVENPKTSQVTQWEIDRYLESA